MRKVATETPSQSVFRHAALVSGLLTREQLDEAIAAAARKTIGPDLAPEQIDDKQLAATAIELGLLNVWQAEQLKAGRTKFNLGEYQVFECIGSGGMGHVFMAEHSMLGRIEAIKVLPKHKTTPESIASFRREIRAQAQLDQPNLVRLSYAGQDGSIYFFVTEYVPGTDLRKLVRTHGKLNMQEAATIISQAAQGLDYAHKRGLVHRDIKPGNLLVTPEGHTKVADLGLAGFLGDEENDPRAGKIVGTADYLAPETFRNPGDVRPASDIYSLGCTLYYAVTGKVPFPGGTSNEKFHRHCNEPPLNPVRFNADLDEAFVEVLADMMEKDPNKRVPSAAEVIRRLAPWTMESVPQTIQHDEMITARRPSAMPPRPMPIPVRDASAANGNGGAPAQEQDFWDVADTVETDPAPESQLASQQTVAASGSEETLPFPKSETLTLGLGLHIYPRSKLLPLCITLGAVVLGLIALFIVK